MSTIPRREFLRTSAAATAGLLIGFRIPLGGQTREATAEFKPNAFLRIAPSGNVTVIVGKAEMGQGIYTALPMIAAEELDADWSKVRVESAPVAPEYKHTVFGVQITGGSTSVLSDYDQLRKAGAEYSELLSLLRELRPQVLADVAAGRHSEQFRKMVDSGALDLLRKGRRREARELLRELQSPDVGLHFDF